MHLKAKKRNKATRSKSKIYLHPHHHNMDGLKAVSTKYKPRCLDDECLLKGIERERACGTVGEESCQSMRWAGNTEQ